jgi:hypothetical protein
LKKKRGGGGVCREKREKEEEEFWKAKKIGKGLSLVLGVLARSPSRFAPFLTCTSSDWLGVSHRCDMCCVGRSELLTTDYLPDSPSYLSTSHIQQYISFPE